MTDSLVSSLHLVLSVLGVIGAADVSVIGGATGALALTAALVAAALVLHAALASRTPDAGGPAIPHPRRAIDVSTLLPQSDPDAEGHARPRAPQSAASAA